MDGADVDVGTSDSSGRGHDLLTSGSVSFASGGRFASYLSDSDGLSASSLDLQPSRVTLVAWVRKSGQETAEELIAGTYDDSAPTCSVTPYGLWHHYSDTSSGVSFQAVNSIGAPINSPEAPDSVWDGDWHMLVGTYDGQRLRLYVDGVEAGGGTSYTAGLNYGTSPAPFAVDGRFTDGCGRVDDFSGGIDEVRVYSRALSATEIARLASPTATTPPTLVPDQPPPPPPPAPARASFASPARSGLADLAIFDASDTTGASELLWDLNSDGRTDVRRSFSEPFLGFRTPVPGPLNVTLTAVGVNGSRSSVTRLTRIEGPSVPNSITFRTLPPPTVASGPTINFLLGVLDLCTPNTTVIFGLAEAKGCFRRLDSLDAVPDAERAVVQQHYQSESFNKVIASICNQAARGELPQSRCDDAKRFFGDKTGLDVYVATKEVKLNGLKITPRGGRSVVVYPKQERVISSNALVTWNGVPVGIPGKVDLNLRSNVRVTGRPTGPQVPPEGQAKLFSFDARNVLPELGGFRPHLTAELFLDVVNGRYRSSADVALTLPKELKVFGDNPPSSRVRVSATNSGGPELDDLDMIVPEANLGPVRLTDLSFKYRRFGGVDGDYNPGTSCARNEWKARGNVFLTGKTGGGLKMTPPPPQNGLGFCNGGFKHLGAEFFFPNPRPQIFPGVTVDSVGFGVQLDPTLVRGGGSLGVADISRVDGELLLAFATPWEPYRMGPNEPRRFNALMGKTFTSTTVAVGGSVYLKTPLGELPFGDAALMYSFPSYVAFGGNVSMVLPGMRAYGGAGGQANLRQRLFDFGANGEVCIAGVRKIKGIPLKPCLGGYARVSSRGAFVCISPLGIDIGAGLYWDSPWPSITPGSCYPSRYWLEGRIEQSSARAAATTTFKVERGQRLKQLRIRGRGDAPKIAIRGPDGETATADTDDLAAGRTIITLRQSQGRVVWVGVKNGKPGTYTITTLPGSVPIESVAGTRKGYDFNFRARVTGRGRKRTLVYDARRKAGQSVEFYEVGRNVYRRIVTSRGGRGRIRFTPAAGPAGVRRIVALATVDRVPAPPRTIARYRAPGIVRAGRPRRVRVKRRGSRLTVRWSRARGAVRYGVVLTLANGQQRTYRVSRRRRTLRIRRVPLTLGGRVSVNAQGFLDDWGRRRTARFKRVRRPFTVVQTDSRNERLTAKRQAAKERKAAKRKRARRKKRKR